MKTRRESMTAALTEILRAINSDAMYTDDPDDRPNAEEIARRAIGLPVLPATSTQSYQITPESYELEHILDRILDYSRGVKLFLPRDYKIDQ
jgi:hypothetical protein